MRYEKGWKDWLKDALAGAVSFGLAAMLAWVFYIAMSSGLFR